MSRLEVNHIFPKAVLYRHGYGKSEVNAVANLCFLTKDTNLQIKATPPEEYFPEIERRYPGALASQWVPMDPGLWRLDRYPEFLAERRRLLADAANAFLTSLLHGEMPELLPEVMPAARLEPVIATSSAMAPGAIESDQEEGALRALNAWVLAQGLADGRLGFELADPATGTQLASLDLAWPRGVQEGRGEPVALLLNEPAGVLAAASAHGFRCFTDVEAFRHYVESEILGSRATLSAAV
jgi:hypothetical protein